MKCSRLSASKEKTYRSWYTADRQSLIRLLQRAWKFSSVPLIRVPLVLVPEHCSLFCMLSRRVRTFLMFIRARRIENSCLRSDSTTRTPKWCNWIWVCRINKCVTCWDPSKEWDAFQCAIIPRIGVCCQDG